MALSKVKGTLERVLDKNLQDLVRGIRNHKENEVSGWCKKWEITESKIQYNDKHASLVVRIMKNIPMYSVTIQLHNQVQLQTIPFPFSYPSDFVP